VKVSNKTNKDKLQGFLNPSKATNPICDIADRFMLDNKYSKAVAAYLSAIIQSNSDIRPYVGASKAYKKLQKYDKAIKNLEVAKGLSSFNSEIYYELGVNHLLSENSAQARRNFIRTIRLDNENVNAQIQLALSHELLDEPQMALSIYQKIIEEFPDLVTVYTHKAALYISLQMYEEAIKTFLMLLDKNPKYYRANLGIGICLDKLGKYAQAIRYYKKYIIKKPKSPTTRALVSRICEMYEKGEILKNKHQLKLVQPEN